MLVAYERIGSAWAATAVLLADLLPSMLLGPLLGGVVDRTSRLGCAIAADLIRAAAMAGLAVFGGTAALLALALAAGAGNALSGRRRAPCCRRSSPPSGSPPRTPSTTRSATSASCSAPSARAR